MSERIFKRREDSVEEIEQTSFKDEEEIQTLIARQPELIIPNESDYELLLIKREMGVPEQFEGGNRWSLDHLFVGSDIKPTLVEVKRSSDNRIYREVIGQMMDYAANGSKYWTKDVLKNALENSLKNDERDVETAISELTDDDLSQEEFWKQVHSNLRSGNIRLVFVSDEIPNELKTTIEFISEQMEKIEVYGVNIRKYKDIYTSDIISSSQAKSTISREEGRQWDRETFLSSIEENWGNDMMEVFSQLYKWYEENEFIVDENAYGSGLTNASWAPYYYNELIEEWYCPVRYYESGHIETQFQYLKKRQGFHSEESRLNMLSVINHIPGVELDNDAITRRRCFSIKILQNTKSFNKFIDFLEWFSEKVRSVDDDLSDDEEGID